MISYVVNLSDKEMLRFNNQQKLQQYIDGHDMLYIFSVSTQSFKGLPEDELEEIFSFVSGGAKRNTQYAIEHQILKGLEVNAIRVGYDPTPRSSKAKRAIIINEHHPKVQRGFRRDSMKGKCFSVIQDGMSVEEYKEKASSKIPGIDINRVSQYLYQFTNSGMVNLVYDYDETKTKKGLAT